MKNIFYANKNWKNNYKTIHIQYLGTIDLPTADISNM